tara:strand:+ start:18506 stop:18751 length:246 start_codon:yes stop_codon:yes gene_type:complete
MEMYLLWGVHMEQSYFIENGRKVPGYRWKNPDGSQGGLVAKTARVDPSATIELHAFVGPAVVVGAGQVVKAGEVLEAATKK